MEIHLASVNFDAMATVTHSDVTIHVPLLHDHNILEVSEIKDWVC